MLLLLLLLLVFDEIVPLTRTDVTVVVGAHAWLNFPLPPPVSLKAAVDYADRLVASGLHDRKIVTVLCDPGYK